MRDLIDRTSLLKFLEHWIKECSTNREKNLLEFVKSGVKNEPCANDNWFKFSELRPEQCEEYKGKHIIDILITTSRGKVTKVQYIQRKNYNGEWEDYWYCGRIYGEAIAWMPLPSAYRVEK